MMSWFPENVSTFGGDIDSLFYLVFYVTGFWFILTEALLAYFAIRYRRRQGRRAIGVHGDTPRQAAWILVPAFIVLSLDLGIDFAGDGVWNTIKSSPPPAAIELRVTGKQFNWEITYPGPDGKFGTDDDLTTENKMEVPVNRTVVLDLSSKDVIHSFSVPSLRLKQDIIPGREIRAWFRATKVGTYGIACTQLCGFGHYTMHGDLIVMSPKDYLVWQQEQWPGIVFGAVADTGGSGG